MHNDNQKYINKFNNYKIESRLHELKQYAIDNEVPIITDDGLSLLLTLTKLRKPKVILELGTAIGYSTLALGLDNPNMKIYTIERNEKNYEIAKSNFAKFDASNIEIFFDDALTFDTSKIGEKVDLIFIDAAKSQYINFFEKYGKLLNDSGVIICDNLEFHGLTEKADAIESKNLRALVRKIDNFNNWLSKNEEYDTTFFENGDGMSVSIKK